MDLTDLLKINKEHIIQTKILKENKQKTSLVKFKLPLGLRNFVDLISQNKYLIFGSNKVGKTQLCHQLSIQAFKYFSRNANNSEENDSVLTLYLDLENTFRPERIQQLAISRNLNYNKVLQSINVSKIMSNSALLLKLKEIKEKGDMENIKVLIIDSINNHYRTDHGSKEFPFHNVKSTFLRILNLIDEISRKFNLIIIATAQISPNFNTSAIVKELPVGNQYLNHFFSEYLYLSIIEDHCQIYLVNSQFLQEKRVYYQITSEGIKDYRYGNAP